VPENNVGLMHQMKYYYQGSEGERLTVSAKALAYNFWDSVLED